MDSSLAKLIEMDLEFEQSWLKDAEKELIHAKSRIDHDLWWGTVHEARKTVRLLQNYLNHLAAREVEENKKAAV